MGSEIGWDARAAADVLLAEIAALPVGTTPALRAVRRSLSTRWRDRPPTFIMGVARALQVSRIYRWVGYELIRYHGAAFTSLNDARLRELSVGLDGWEVVDAFARIVSGPAWVCGLASDTLIRRWAASADRWKRRTALVSTVALNMKADGGEGDPERTLAVCATLAGDRDDMVERALSWALRALAGRDSGAVRRFMATEDARLGARVKREVRNKLATGLKQKRPGGSKRGGV
jgi:3-methyladenine DNA glycosylase AlkD